MSNKNQMALQVTRTNSFVHNAVNIRSNQLNPDNSKYMMSWENSTVKLSSDKDSPCDWDEDTFGDDWEFNYD